MTIVGQDDARVAACAVMARLGHRGTPILLGQSMKNQSLLFESAAVVVRITNRNRLQSLSSELDVANGLAANRAPIVLPSRDPAAGPYVEGEFAMTLWEYVQPLPVDPESEICLKAAADALGRIHGVALDFSAKVPSYLSQIEKCKMRLADNVGLSELSHDGRALLLDVLQIQVSSCENIPVRPAVLHGDAHMGNVLFTSQGAVWLDLEDICLGPREWDMCRFGHPEFFANIDSQLLAHLTVLRSVCVATWCWASAADPEMRRHAIQHTEIAAASLRD